MNCPLCANSREVGKVPSAKVDPQNVLEYDICPVCYGSGEVEEIHTSKQQIVIYYADYARQITNV